MQASERQARTENSYLWMALLVAGVWMYSQGLFVLPSWSSPLPVTVDGPHMLIVEETSERGTIDFEQSGIFTSVELREYLDAKDFAWRMFDKDVDTDFEAEVWQDALKMDTKLLPWLFVWNGRRGKSMPLPDDVAGVIAELEGFE